MRISSRLPSVVRAFGILAPATVGLAIGLVSATAASSPADDAALRVAPRVSIDPGTGDVVEHVGVCAGTGKYHCFARVVTRRNAHVVSHANVQGTTAATIEDAYGITDLSAGADKTVAIIDAYGYSALEADLATYRSQMGLPPCTVASGCLKIVNSSGQTSPLPANPPSTDDWTVETALDVDMVSAACPACKILVIQTSQPDATLDQSQALAKSLGASVISDSWGGPEAGTENQSDAGYYQQGLPIFVAAGDDGYDDNGQGPDYPGTSAYTIAVGATSLTHTPSGNRAYTEVTWGGAGSTAYSSAQITQTGAGGSACSKSIPKPSYQPSNTQCQYKATADVSALGDPATGPAIYDSQAATGAGWMQIGGTSASSPMVAAMIAASGNTGITGKFFYDNEGKFHDVTSGTNGSCANILCVAGPGWDGPTGVGTPNVTALRNNGGDGSLSAAITAPADGATVGEGFEVDTQLGAGAVRAQLLIDGTQVDEQTAAPFTFSAPTSLAAGPHTIGIRAYDASGNAMESSTITVTVSLTAPGGGGGGGNADSNEVVGGCAAGGSGAGLGGVLLALGLALSRRRTARD